MNIKRVPPTGDHDDVIVEGDDFTFTVRVSGTLSATWGNDSVEQIAMAIVKNHDPSNPFEKVYEYKDMGSITLDQMLDWVKRNRP